MYRDIKQQTEPVEHDTNVMIKVYRIVHEVPLRFLRDLHDICSFSDIWSEKNLKSEDFDIYLFTDVREKLERYYEKGRVIPVGHIRGFDLSFTHERKTKKNSEMKLDENEEIHFFLQHWNRGESYILVSYQDEKDIFGLVSDIKPEENTVYCSKIYGRKIVRSFQDEEFSLEELSNVLNNFWRITNHIPNNKYVELENSEVYSFI